MPSNERRVFKLQVDFLVDGTALGAGVDLSHNATEALIDAEALLTWQAREHVVWSQEEERVANVPATTLRQRESPAHS